MGWLCGAGPIQTPRMLSPLPVPGAHLALGGGLGGAALFAGGRLDGPAGQRGDHVALGIEQQLRGHRLHLQAGGGRRAGRCDAGGVHHPGEGPDHLGSGIFAGHPIEPTPPLTPTPPRPPAAALPVPARWSGAAPRCSARWGWCWRSRGRPPESPGAASAPPGKRHRSAGGARGAVTPPTHGQCGSSPRPVPARDGREGSASHGDGETEAGEGPRGGTEPFTRGTRGGKLGAGGGWAARLLTMPALKANPAGCTAMWGCVSSGFAAGAALGCGRMGGGWAGAAGYALCGCGGGRG